METDPEVKGEAGNHYTTYFRQYDPRVGRWWSRDPVTHPWESPYASMYGNPIYYSDVLGASGEAGGSSGSSPLDPAPGGGDGGDGGFPGPTIPPPFIPDPFSREYISADGSRLTLNLMDAVTTYGEVRRLTDGEIVPRSKLNVASGTNLWAINSRVYGKFAGRWEPNSEGRYDFAGFYQIVDGEWGLSYEEAVRRHQASVSVLNNELFAPNFWGVLRAWIESDRMWWESNEAYGLRRFGGGLLYETVDNVHVVGTYLLNKFIHGEGYGEHLDNTQGIEWGGNDMVVRAGNVGALLMSPGASRGSVLIDDVAKTTNRPFAMGIEDYLDDFARQHNAMTWKEFDDAVNWQPQVLEKLSDPKLDFIPQLP